MQFESSILTERPGFITALLEETGTGTRVEVYSALSVRPWKSPLYSPIWETIGDRCYSESDTARCRDTLMIGYHARSHAFETFNECPGASREHTCRNK